MTPGVFACCGLVGGWGHADVCRCVHKLRQGAPQPICDLWGNGFLRRSLPKFMHISSRVAGLVAQ